MYMKNGLNWLAVSLSLFNMLCMGFQSVLQFSKFQIPYESHTIGFTKKASGNVENKFAYPLPSGGKF